MFKPSDRKNYLISGIFISVLLLIVMVTIFMLNKENPLFSSKIQIKTQVKSAQNLKDGAAVQLRGIKVGSIQTIEFKDLNTLEITLGVTEKYRTWIKKDSEINFKTQGVLGDKFLEITGGTETSEAVEEGDLLVTNEGSQFDQIITKSEDLMIVAGNVLGKVDKMIGKIEDNRIEKILVKLEQLTSNTNKVMA